MGLGGSRERKRKRVRHRERDPNNDLFYFDTPSRALVLGPVVQSTEAHQLLPFKIRGVSKVGLSRS